jgi:hypothetical protein
MLWASASLRSGPLAPVFAGMANALQQLIGDDPKLFAPLAGGALSPALPVLTPTMKLSHGGWFGPNAPGAYNLTP